MKKKVKLFTTIASLCLAVALMAFGVYAATKVTYNVSGTVKYEMKDVLASVTTEVSKASITTQLAKQGTSYALVDVEGEGLAFTWSAVGDAQTTTTYDANNQIKDGTPEGEENHKETSAANHTIDINFNNASAYKVVMTITNKNASGITSTVKTDFESGDNYTVLKKVMVDESTEYTGGQVTREQTLVYTYYFIINDITEAIDSANIAWQAELAQYVAPTNP